MGSIKGEGAVFLLLMSSLYLFAWSFVTLSVRFCYWLWFGFLFVSPRGGRNSIYTNYLLLVKLFCIYVCMYLYIGMYVLVSFLQEKNELN